MNKHDLRLIFWELTAACNLRCQHCRAEAKEEAAENELTTEQLVKVARDIRKVADPIVILTGGEPLIRADFDEIAKTCSELFSRVALASNGTMIDDLKAEEIKGLGINRVSVSLDGSVAETHDRFRGVPGSFNDALMGCKAITRAGLSLQVNVTLTQENSEELEKILDLSLELGADAFHVFVLVPVGCGVVIADDQRIPPEKLENILTWLFQRFRALKNRIHIKATCAPQYYRILHENHQEVSPSGHPGMEAISRGCLAGSSVCFLSRKGDIQPCGYLPVKAGNVLEKNFGKIWDNSELFQDLRDPGCLEGKCGYCEYRRLCQGCRARAFAADGNFLGADPDCVFIPAKGRETKD